ncbi:EF-hand domain-containing protein [Rudaea sp.]|uniref:EF-hand domain-containing protein n=1 Tax=Rudaea sp. TaxID=2136325 RepID=UPI002ED5233B
MKSHTPTVPAVCAAIAFALANATAFAAPPPDPTDPTQPSTPMQRSGQVESPASLQARFEALDLNHDGYIDKTEASANKMLSAQFDKLDANHDGKLSPAEFAKAKGLAAPTGSSTDQP